MDSTVSASKDLHHNTYSVLLNDIVNYIKSYNGLTDSACIDGVIPSATFLTGVNQPDNESQFLILAERIRDEVTPHVAMVNSQDASTLKQLVENSVWQLIHGHEGLHYEEDSDDINQSPKFIKKNQCTMKILRNWYHKRYINTPKTNKNDALKKCLVIIIPDFESFNCNILQDFVMIVSSYVSSMPIVFVFGVATSVSALHKSFPYQVSSKLQMKVFQSDTSIMHINQVLEDIFLTHTSLLHLSGKAFMFLTDVFLFYDFSVTDLIQNIKYCMLEHYYEDNTKTLCCSINELRAALAELNAEDLENIRRLMSFRPYAEATHCTNRIKLFNDDDFFREVLFKEITKLHNYLYSFYTNIRLLVVFVKDLPTTAIGKTIPEIYAKCSDDCITDTQAFKDCMQLLNFQSQVQLAQCIKNALKIINSALNITSPVRSFRSTPKKNNLENIELHNNLGEIFLKTVKVHLLMFLRQVKNSNTEFTGSNKLPAETESDSEEVSGNRHKLKKKLLHATRTGTIQSEFEMVRSRFVSYLEEMFSKALLPPRTQPFFEIMFFSDVDSVKKKIVGSPRGALHIALTNPAHYLQCSCCHLPSTESIIDTLPDLCIAYKLHLECSKHINLYDWLQAFAAVLRPDEDEEQRHQDASILLRFTRAVAELQFLGFIKPSKRKTDHVMKLTW